MNASLSGISKNIFVFIKILKICSVSATENDGSRNEFYIPSLELINVTGALNCCRLVSANRDNEQLTRIFLPPERVIPPAIFLSVHVTSFSYSKWDAVSVMVVPHSLYVVTKPYSLFGIYFLTVQLVSRRVIKELLVTVMAGSRYISIASGLQTTLMLPSAKE